MATATEWARLMAAMDSRDIDDEIQINRINDLERRSRFIQIFLISLLVVIIATPFILAWWVSASADYIRQVSIDNVRITGSSALCPGDLLRYEFDFSGKGRGTLDEDKTLFRMTPPATVIASTTDRYILAGDFERHVKRVYTVPHHYVDEATGEITPLTPGIYRRLLSISSPTRSSTVDVEYVEFTVRSDCP